MCILSTFFRSLNRLICKFCFYSFLLLLIFVFVFEILIGAVNICSALSHNFPVGLIVTEGRSSKGFVHLAMNNFLRSLGRIRSAKILVQTVSS